MKAQSKEKRINDSIDKILDELLKDFFSKPANRKTNAQGGEKWQSDFLMRVASGPR